MGDIFNVLANMVRSRPPAPVRIHRAHADGNLLKIMGPTMQWVISLPTPERAYDAACYVRQHGVRQSAKAVHHLLMNF